MIKRRRQTRPPAANPEQPKPRWAPFAAALWLLGVSLGIQGASRTEPRCEILDQELTGRSPTNKSVVLIIDDIGNQLELGRAAIALPGNLTLAVLPFTPHGSDLAKLAHRAGKEVMLHAPMSNVSNHDTGPGALTPQLSEQEFRRALGAALGDVPHVRGVNNHMGSELTQRREQMGWLMQELGQQQLYFVDSRTSSETVAARVAQEYGIPHLSRHVFLDNDKSVSAIHERFTVLLKRVQEEGIAVAIGHPYPETLAYLQRALPGLEQRGIRLVAVSQVLTGNGPSVAVLPAGNNAGS